MHGSVWELLNDWYDPSYATNFRLENPMGPPTGSRKVVRGGYWDFNPAFLRTAMRGDIGQLETFSAQGFRLVRRVED